MAEEKDEVVVKKETKKFTWRIDNFSELKEAKIYSDTFSAGAHNWRFLVFPKGNKVDKHLSVYLEFADDKKTMPSGWSVGADIRFTLVAQRSGSSSLQRGTTHCFQKDEDDWGYTSFVPLVDLPQKGYLVNDNLILEVEVSTEASDESKLVKVDTAANGNTSTSSSSPSHVQLATQNLIAEISTMSSTHNHNSSSSDGISLLQQQREKLYGFFDVTLEALFQDKSIDQVESVALEISVLTTDPLQQAILKDLLSRLAEFKETVPPSLSAIETSDAIELSKSQMIKDLEERLVHTKGQLKSLDAEVSRLREEGTKLEAEIQQLSARKAKNVEHVKTSAVELEKANQEASKELEELRKQHEERKQAGEERRRAMENLAQANASWKLFKNLGWQ